MKRSTKHIKKTLAYVEHAWKKHPDLRLGQLLANVAGLNDIFYLEDGVLIVSIKKWTKFWDATGGYKKWENLE